MIKQVKRFSENLLILRQKFYNSSGNKLIYTSAPNAQVVELAYTLVSETKFYGFKSRPEYQVSFNVSQRGGMVYTLG